MGQLFNPPPFRIVQPLFQSIHDGFIDGFRLPITLWVGRCGVSIDDSQLITVFSKGFAVKLEAVVRDQCVRGPEPSDNIFLDKFLDIDVPDVCQRLSFDPFREVIGGDEKKLLVPGRFGERP